MKPQRNIPLKRRSISRGGGSPWAAGHVPAPSPAGGTRAWHPCMAPVRGQATGRGSWRPRRQSRSAARAPSLRRGSCFLPSPRGGGTRSNAPPRASDFAARSRFLLRQGHHPAPPPRHAAGKKAPSVTSHTLPRPLTSEETIRTAERVCVASARETAPGPRRALPHVHTGSPGGRPAPGAGGSCLPLSPALPFLPLSTAQSSSCARRKIPFKSDESEPPRCSGTGCPLLAAGSAAQRRRHGAAGPGSCTALVYAACGEKVKVPPRASQRRLRFLPGEPPVSAAARQGPGVTEKGRRKLQPRGKAPRDKQPRFPASSGRRGEGCGALEAAPAHPAQYRAPQAAARSRCSKVGTAERTWRQISRGRATAKRKADVLSGWFSIYRHTHPAGGRLGTGLRPPQLRAWGRKPPRSAPGCWTRGRDRSAWEVGAWIPVSSRCGLERVNAWIYRQARAGAGQDEGQDERFQGHFVVQSSGEV